MVLGIDFSSAQGDETVIIIGTIEGSSIIKPGMPYVHKIFQRIHIKSIEQTVPAERAVSMANMGETDADPYRIEGLEKDYPNLIRVPGSLYLSTIVASSTNPKLKIDGWDSLKPYRICARLGIKAVEERVKGMNVFFSRSTKSQAQMMLRGRCDVMIHHRGEWMEINRAQLAGLYELSPPLEQRDLFLYVNKKHADLVPKLAEAIEKMREEGQWTELNNKIEAEIAEAKAEVLKRGEKKISWPYISPKNRQKPPPTQQPTE
jgi:polar amino acid transport system substrate-binding protein